MTLWVRNHVPGATPLNVSRNGVKETSRPHAAREAPRISSLRGDEPWPGYDELTADEVRAALGEADEQGIARVRSYERAHKTRKSVLELTERAPANA